VDDWTLEPTSGDGEPWPGGGRSTFGWHGAGAHLIQRSTVELPDAPDGISILGCDAANGTYVQLYPDERGVCRVYEMSIGAGEWKLWRDGEPFPQRASSGRSARTETRSPAAGRRPRTAPTTRST